jgi:hypothetical protein
MAWGTRLVAFTWVALGKPRRQVAPLFENAKHLTIEDRPIRKSLVHFALPAKVSGSRTSARPNCSPRRQGS